MKKKLKPGAASSTGIVAVNRAIELSADSAQAWCHMAPFGQHMTTLIHPTGKHERVPLSYGLENFELVVAGVKALNAKPGFRGLMINCDHLAHFETGTTASFGQAKDAKIIGDGAAEGDGLYYLVEFNPTGAAKVHNREFSFLSGEFDIGEFDDGSKGIIAPDAKWAAALTNDPNLPVKALNRAVAFASGTALNGDVPGHEFHGNQHTAAAESLSSAADDKTVRAHAASKFAHEEGDHNKVAHFDAATKAHEEAVAAHTAAAKAHADAGNARTAGAHQQQAHWHGYMAAQSKQIADHYRGGATSHNRAPTSGQSASADAGQHKPAAKAAKGKNTMDYKAMLIDLLGLKATASDDEIEAAFKVEVPEEETESDEGDKPEAKAMNRLIRLQAKKLADAKQTKLAAEADAFCDANKTKIHNRAEVHKQYLANPAATKALFASLVAGEAKPAKVLNRAEAKTPADRDAADPEAAKVQRKQMQDADIENVRVTCSCRNRAEAESLSRQTHPWLYT